MPEVTQTAGEMATFVSLVNSGLGEAILPFSAVRHRPVGVSVCTITDKLPLSEIGMITVSNAKPPAIERFCELAQIVLVSERVKANALLPRAPKFLYDEAFLLSR